jgi:hypothetical protein
LAYAFKYFIRKNTYTLSQRSPSPPFLARGTCEMPEQFTMTVQYSLLPSHWKLVLPW